MISNDNILSEANVEYVATKALSVSPQYSYLEYLESQYSAPRVGSHIELDFPLKQNSYIEAEFEMVPVGTGMSTIGFFGSANSSDPSKYFFLRFSVTNVRLNFNVFGTTNVIRNFDPFHHFYIKYDHGKYYVDNVLQKDFGTGSQTADSNCFIFCNQVNGIANFHADMKLYRFKLIDDEHTINLIPAKRISDNVLGLYDDQNDRFYTNSGDLPFVGGPETGKNNGKTLPKKVEYLESTEQQYIDLGIHTTDKTRIKMKCVMTKIGTTKGSYGIIFGDSYPSWTTGHEIYIWQTDYGILGFRASYGDELFDSDVPINVGDILEIDFNKNHLTIYVNGIESVEHVYATKTFISPNTLEVFKIPRDDPEYYGNMKLYDAQIYEDDVLIQDLICVDDNGSPAVFDMLNRKYYYNLGTSGFIEGPVITRTYSSLKPATLKTVSDILLYSEKEEYKNYQVNSKNLDYILDLVPIKRISDGKMA